MLNMLVRIDSEYSYLMRISVIRIQGYISLLLSYAEPKYSGAIENFGADKISGSIM
jgi:hypothetical protein